MCRIKINNIIKHFFNYFSLKNANSGSHNQDRPAGYPTVLSQILACGSSAQGSSVLLTSYKMQRLTNKQQIDVSYLVALFLIYLTVRFAYVYQPVLSAYVSFLRFAILSFPSPCERTDRLRVLWNDLTHYSSSDSLLALYYLTFYLQRKA